jgi:hypothetical protein
VPAAEPSPAEHASKAEGRTPAPLGGGDAGEQAGAGDGGTVEPVALIPPETGSEERAPSTARTPEGTPAP